MLEFATAQTAAPLAATGFWTDVDIAATPRGSQTAVQRVRKIVFNHATTAWTIAGTMQALIRCMFATHKALLTMTSGMHHVQAATAYRVQTYPGGKLPYGGM